MIEVPPQGFDLLLTHATVITMDTDRRVLSDGAVGIIGNRIAAIGATTELEGFHSLRTIDCAGKAVLPGFIDAHGHAGHSLIKTLGSDTPAAWMSIVTPAYFHFTTRSFWYADGLLSAVERLRAGVTTGLSVIGSAPRSDDAEFGIAHARAYTEVGIREIVAVGPCAPPWPHPVSSWDAGYRVRRLVSHEEALEGAEAVIEACDGAGNGLIRVFITPFTIVPSLDPSHPSPPELATTLTAFDRHQSRRIREIAAKWGVRIHSDAFGGMVRLAAQDESALLGPDVHLQHCIGISLEEVEILASTGTHVGHAAGGRAPVIAMMTRGVNVAVTTDGASRRPFDLLQAARNVQAAQHLLNGDWALLPVGKLLEMITVDAAAALGMSEEIGSIEVGKKADLNVIDLRQPHLVPNWMPVHRLIYQGDGHDVETVIIDGRVIMEGRVVQTVDIAAILAQADVEAHGLVKRAGLETHLSSPSWGQVRLTFDTPPVLPS